MNVIIIGCGKLGAELAYRLYMRGQKVVIVDHNPEAFNNLPHDFKGRMHEGEALDKEVLRRAGIENCDALACVTGSDALNAVLGHAAQIEYHVEKIFARNYDPQFSSLFDMYGLQTVCSAVWGAQRLEELIYFSETRSVFSAGNGEIEVYEIPVPAHWHGISLQEIIPCNDCLPFSLTRNGKAFLPALSTQVETGDILHISSTLEGIEHLRKQLKLEQE